MLRYEEEGSQSRNDTRIITLDIPCPLLSDSNLFWCDTEIPRTEDTCSGLARLCLSLLLGGKSLIILHVCVRIPSLSRGWGFLVFRQKSPFLREWPNYRWIFHAELQFMQKGPCVKSQEICTLSCPHSADSVPLLPGFSLTFLWC